MSIKIGSKTFPNGGTAKFGSKSLSAIKFDQKLVWKKEMTFAGSSQAWNNTHSSNYATFVSGMDLRGFSQISFTVSYGARGWAGGAAYGVRHAIGSGDSAGTAMRIIWGDGTYTEVIGAYGNGQGTGIGCPVLPKTFTYSLSGKSDTQLSNVKIIATGSFSYSDPINKFVIMDWTVGTVTAS